MDIDDCLLELENPHYFFDAGQNMLIVKNTPGNDKQKAFDQIKKGEKQKEVGFIVDDVTCEELLKTHFKDNILAITVYDEKTNKSIVLQNNSFTFKKKGVRAGKHRVALLIKKKKSGQSRSQAQVVDANTTAEAILLQDDEPNTTVPEHEIIQKLRQMTTHVCRNKSRENFDKYYDLLEGINKNKTTRDIVKNSNATLINSNPPVFVSDVLRLLPLGWLSNNLIELALYQGADKYNDVFVIPSYNHATPAKLFQMAKKQNRIKLQQAKKIVMPVWINRNHWVVVTAEKTSRKFTTFNIHDSLPPNADISANDTLFAILDYLKTTYPLLVSKNYKVQPGLSKQQINGSDCGLFAIFNALSFVGIKNVEPSATDGTGDSKIYRKNLLANILCNSRSIASLGVPPSVCDNYTRDTTKLDFMYYHCLRQNKYDEATILRELRKEMKQRNLTAFNIQSSSQEQLPTFNLPSAAAMDTFNLPSAAAMDTFNLPSAAAMESFNLPSAAAMDSFNLPSAATMDTFNLPSAAAMDSFNLPSAAAMDKKKAKQQAEAVKKQEAKKEAVAKKAKQQAEAVKKQEAKKEAAAKKAKQQAEALKKEEAKKEAAAKKAKQQAEAVKKQQAKKEAAAKKAKQQAEALKKEEAKKEAAAKKAKQQAEAVKKEIYNLPSRLSSKKIPVTSAKEIDHMANYFNFDLSPISPLQKRVASSKKSITSKKAKPSAAKKPEVKPSAAKKSVVSTKAKPSAAKKPEVKPSAAKKSVVSTKATPSAAMKPEVKPSAAKKSVVSTKAKPSTAKKPEVKPSAAMKPEVKPSAAKKSVVSTKAKPSTAKKPEVKPSAAMKPEAKPSAAMKPEAKPSAAKKSVVSTKAKPSTAMKSVVSTKAKPSAAKKPEVKPSAAMKSVVSTKTKPYVDDWFQDEVQQLVTQMTNLKPMVIKSRESELNRLGSGGSPQINIFDLEIKDQGLVNYKNKIYQIVRNKKLTEGAEGKITYIRAKSSENTKEIDFVIKESKRRDRSLGELKIKDQVERLSQTKECKGLITYFKALKDRSIAMNFAKSNLKRLLGRLSVSQTAEIVESVRKALKCLKKEDLYYIDLKAENVLLFTDEKEQVTIELADLGSCVADSKKQMKATFPFKQFIDGNIPLDVVKDNHAKIYNYQLALLAAYLLVGDKYNMQFVNEAMIVHYIKRSTKSTSFTNILGSDQANKLYEFPEKFNGNELTKDFKTLIKDVIQYQQEKHWDEKLLKLVKLLTERGKKEAPPAQAFINRIINALLNPQAVHFDVPYLRKI